MQQTLLQSLANDIWVLDHPFQLLGVSVGIRSTLVRLNENELWLLAPGPLVKAAYKDIAALGEVTALVAPNTMHHLYLKSASQLFPKATVYGPKRLQKKYPHFKITPLDEGVYCQWEPALQHHEIQGLKVLDEIAFFHTPSGYLLLTDLLFNITEAPNLWSKSMLTSYGVYKKTGPSKAIRYLALKDRQALKHSIQTLLNWPIQGMVVAHGDVLSESASENLEQAFCWL